MEYNFLNTQGTLAEKLMAAMQGANFPGADERCLDEGTSSATAFLVVYNSDDNPNQPSLEFNIASQPPGIEPIDLLQEMFDENLSVENSTIEELSLFPNPSDGIITLKSEKNYKLDIYTVDGKIILNPPKNTPVNHEDELIVFAEDDSTIKYFDEPVFSPTIASIPDVETSIRNQRVALLNWTTKTKIIVEILLFLKILFSKRSM